MAKQQIKLNPNLNKDQLQGMFQKQFAGKYEGYSTKWPNL